MSDSLNFLWGSPKQVVRFCHFGQLNNSPGYVLQLRGSLTKVERAVFKKIDFEGLTSLLVGSAIRIFGRTYGAKARGPTFDPTAGLL